MSDIFEIKPLSNAGAVMVTKGTAEPGDKAFYISARLKDVMPAIEKSGIRKEIFTMTFQCPDCGETCIAHKEAHDECLAHAKSLGVELAYICDICMFAKSKDEEPTP